MLIYTKYSNERSAEFCIRTDILQEQDGSRIVQKKAASAHAWKHVQKIYEHSLELKRDLKGTPFAVNDCKLCSEGVCFPFLTGRTLEEELDQLLQQRKMEELLERITQYFAAFTQDGLQEFRPTPEFEHVFGSVCFAEKQYSRSVSDIDMIFSNVVCTETGYELIDYEWTFSFPVPVNYIVYRALHYYVYGSAARSSLAELDLFARFEISEAEQAQFAAMEKNFQAYMRGTYTPLWMQYEDISPGTVNVRKIAQQASSRKRCSRVDLFLDDGRGFGVWNCRHFEAEAGEWVSMELQLPEGTKAVRLDPCTGQSVVRLEVLQQNGVNLSYTCNGQRAGNGDLIFDTEDPQIIFEAEAGSTLQIRFLAEPLGVLERELILYQHGRIRWMEQTKAWKLYQKIKGKHI